MFFSMPKISAFLFTNKLIPDVRCLLRFYEGYLIFRIIRRPTRTLDIGRSLANLLRKREFSNSKSNKSPGQYSLDKVECVYEIQMVSDSQFLNWKYILYNRF